jgi:NAD(P)-dependent dehydrogenase (short-subunit alcohol dehydrogenase family)
MTSRSATNVVIGASSGMGRAVARRLAPRGPLLLADRDHDGAKTVAAELGGDVTTIRCDVTDDGDVETLATAADRLGALVLTAGLSPHMGAGRTILAVNLLGADRVLRAFEPILEPGSAAVCFASMAAHLIPADPAVDALIDHPESPTLLDDLAALGLVDHSGLAYAVSKRGVIRLVQRRAALWGAAGARLLSLSPGIIDTPMGRLEDGHEPAMADMVTASPLARQGHADEVAAVAAFLVSTEASYMTAVDVLVDGGTVSAAQ